MRKIVLLSLIAATAAAEPRIEVGAAVGGHAFSPQSELGVDDDMSLPGPASSIAIGARAAYVVIPHLAIEGEALAIPTRDTGAGDSALAFGLRAHVRYDILRGRIVPFVVAGAGMHILEPTSPQMKADADQSFHWGAGVRYALSALLDVRLDARHLIVPSRSFNGATSDFELTAGVTWHIGAHASPAQRAQPAVVAAPGEP